MGRSRPTVPGRRTRKALHVPPAVARGLRKPSVRHPLRGVAKRPSWKLVGLAGIAGVAATGVVVARNRRAQRDLPPDELRERLHGRLAQADPPPPPADPPIASPAAPADPAAHTDPPPPA
jgi:hypothetical protein